MKFVLCDEDELFRSMVESIVAAHGHEIIGIADRTMEGTALVERGRPDVVILDMTLGYNTDFNILDAAERAGSVVIVFSFSAPVTELEAKNLNVTVVPKPDFEALERTIERLVVAEDSTPTQQDRRQRPPRAADGPMPSGLRDAGAFYEAVNNATNGDTLAAFDLPSEGDPYDGEALAIEVDKRIRSGDRLLGSPTCVRVFLAGGERDAFDSLVSRLRSDRKLTPGTQIRYVVVGADETGAEAFDRLKNAGASVTT